MDNVMNFIKDPFMSLILGVDDDKLKDKNLEEVIDCVLRKKITDGIKEMSEGDLERKVKRAKNRLASFIEELGEHDIYGINPFVLLMILFMGGSGNIVMNGLREIFTDKDGNVMSEDMFNNEYIPLSNKVIEIGTLIRDIEELTEENTCGRFVPGIARDLFVCKDELLEFLKKRKEQFSEKLEKITKQYMKNL